MIENLAVPALETPSWYVVYTKPRKEEVALFHLKRKGLAVFFPRVLLPQSLPKRRRVAPLFPSYLFVQLQAPEECNYVHWSPGVRCLVGFQGTPTPLDDTVVAFLQKEADSDGVITANLQLAVGEKVRITAGAFAGLVGIVYDPPDAKGRVRVLMQLLSRSVKVEIPTQFVESNWSIEIGQ